MTAARGLSLLYTDGRPIGNLSDSFMFLGKGDIAGIPFPIFIFLLAGIVSHILLNQTRFGKYTYAIGGNEQAARICGIPVDRYKIFNLHICRTSNRYCRLNANSTYFCGTAKPWCRV
ncbi:hypothetical protein GCM10020331_100940 [Ectobacillus funiculus]